MNPTFFKSCSSLALVLAVVGAVSPSVAIAQDPVMPALSSDPGEALGQYLRQLAVEPNNLEALTGAGKAALAVGDPNAAIGFLARGEELAPRDGRIKAAIGSALVQMQQPREALRLFDEATALGVPAADVASDRGLAYDLRGENLRAQADYATALRAHSDDETIRRLALSKGMSGDRAGAIKLLDPLLRKQDKAAWRAQAFVLAMTGDARGAADQVKLLMPANQASAMAPFMTRLAALTPDQKAMAVHFGVMPSSATGAQPPVTYAAANPSPAPVVAPPAAPTVMAAATPQRSGRSRRGEDRVQLASREPTPAPAPVSRTVTPTPAPAVTTAVATQPAAAPVAMQTAAAAPVAAPKTRASDPYSISSTVRQEWAAVRGFDVQQYLYNRAKRDAAKAAPTPAAAPVQVAQATPKPAPAAPVQVAQAAPRPAPVVSQPAPAAPVRVADAAPKPAPVVAPQPAPAAVQLAQAAPASSEPRTAAGPPVPLDIAARTQLYAAAETPRVPTAIAPAPVYSDEPSPAARAEVAEALRTRAHADGATSGPGDAGATTASANPTLQPSAISGASVPVQLASIPASAPAAPPPPTIAAPSPVTPEAPVLRARTRTADAAPAAVEETRSVAPRRRPGAATGGDEAKPVRTASNETSPKRSTRASDDSDDAVPAKGKAAAAASRANGKGKAVRVADAADEESDGKSSKTGKTSDTKKGVKLADASDSRGAKGKRAADDEESDARPVKKGVRSASRDADDSDGKPAGKGAKSASKSEDDSGARSSKKGTQLASRSADGDDAKAGKSSKAGSKAKAGDDDENAKTGSRHWVQVSGGSDASTLPKEYSKLKKKYPELLAKRSGYATPLKDTNRLLVGPFKSDEEAQAFVNSSMKKGLQSFTFTSSKGQKVDKLASE